MNITRSHIVAISQVILVLYFIIYWIIKSIIHFDKLNFIIILGFPFTLMFILFPINFLTNNIINLFYPCFKMLENSKYYIVSPPKKPPEYTPYPPITIQIPVYTEDFKVIKETIISAIKVRNEYPGYCNIVIPEDGLLVINQDERNEREQWYNENNIGYIARPKQNRKGRFKKASNLNNHFKCFENILKNEPLPENLVTGGDITIGQYIILLDADSRMGSNISEAVCYMLINPNVAFMQFKTKPLENYKDNYFSYQIGLFTFNLYNIVFSIVTRGGEPAPLVGHNAIISYQALKDVKITENEYWNENKVSEDFDFSIRAQIKGYIGVYGVFTEFQEGVSFTFADELAKLSKFAYGASELILSKKFYQYLFSKKIPWASKVNLSSYMFSYYAIASSIIISPLHMILVCYIPDWYIITLEPNIVALFSFCLFSLLGPISSTSILWRIVYKGRFWWILKEQFIHGLFMFCFFASIPFYIFQGTLSHLLRLPLIWGATRKTIDQKETVSNVIYTFRVQYVVMVLFLMLMIILYLFVCSSWYGYIPGIVMCFAHLINPITMSPYLFKSPEIDLPV